MLACFKCQKQYPSSQQLISHLRVEHGYYPGPKLFCSQQGCRLQFLTYAGFRKHLNSVHSNIQHISQTSTAACSSSEPVASSSSQPVASSSSQPVASSSSSVGSVSNDSEPTNDQTNEMCASIVAKLQGSGISNSMVSSIVGDLEELTSQLRSQAKDKVISALPVTDPNISVINESFENPFTNLNTEWKRNKYFNLKWGVVEPVEIPLGIRYDIR